MLPVILHVLAFIVGLNVQGMASVFVGDWVFLVVLGCVLLVYNQRYPKQKTAVWWGCAAWALALGVSTFFVTPVANGAAYMWILLALPVLPLCLHDGDLDTYTRWFGRVIYLYACGLLAQYILYPLVPEAYHNHGVFNYDARYAWPLIDPNNAAAVLNLALVPALYMTLFKSKRWGANVLFLFLAMAATGSKAGFLAAGAAGFLLLAVRYPRFFWLQSVATGVAASLVYFFCPAVIDRLNDSLVDRLPIWENAWYIVQHHFWRGTGLGTFLLQTRIDFAHNDVLQFAAEMGVPVAAVFAGLVTVTAATTSRDNIAAGATMLAIFLQSLTEFQLYLPVISLGMGLALGHHINHRRVAGFLGLHRVVQPR